MSFFRKLFSKSRDHTEELKLQVAGAIVAHSSPFQNLESYRNETELSQDFVDEWVNPFYMRIGSTDDEWIIKLKQIKSGITEEIVKKNLGDFNWRTRQTGAFMAAINNQPQFIDIIGTHLLKSEVCYAGAVYCSVLASFNTVASVKYINQYLDYYLTQPDLWFDQASAMEAILYLDKVNSTNYFANHAENWTKFLKNKPYWNKEVSTRNIEKQLAVIEVIKRA